MFASLHEGQIVEVEIETMDDEGRGRGVVSFSDNSEYDVAVRGAFIGDVVKATIERVFAARKLLVCRISTMILEGPLHTERTCPHQTPCPACPLHGVDTSLMWEIKTSRIERALEDAGLDFSVQDLIPHPNEFSYRQKVKLMVGGKKGELVFGVYVPYSHKLVAADLCPYVRDQINVAAQVIKEKLNSLKIAPHHAEAPGLLAVILRATKLGVAAILVTRTPLSENDFKELEKLVSDAHLVSITERHHEEETNNILAGDAVRHFGPTRLPMLEGGPPAEADSFCQSDPEQAENMYDLVAEYLVDEQTNINDTHWFVDGYAGVGGFSRALKRRGVKNIVAIEQAPSCLESLKDLEVVVELSPMAQALDNIKRLGTIEGMVIDPPKKGLMNDATPLSQFNARRVVLVSCDPDAMAKDLSVFVNAGYHVEKIMPLDLFGGTPAVETLIFMRSESAK